MPKRFDRILKPGESTGNLIPWYQRTVLWGGLYFLAKFFWSFGGWPHYEVLPFQFPVPTKLDWRMSLNWRNLIWFPSHHDPGTSPGVWGWFWVQAIGGAITSFSYPSLSGHLEWTGDGLVPEPDPDKGQGATPYAGGPFTVQTSDEHPFTVLFVLQPANWWIFEWYLLSGLSFEFIVAPEEEQTDEYKEWYDDYYRDYPGGSEFPTVETRPPSKSKIKRPRYGGGTRGKLPETKEPVDWEPGVISTPDDGWTGGKLPEGPYNPEPSDGGNSYPLPDEPGAPGPTTTVPTPSEPDRPSEPQDPEGGGQDPKAPGSPGGSIPTSGEDTEREIIIVLKDYDIYYTDQNESLEPVVNIGPPVVARAGEEVSLSASKSWSLTAPITSCLWDIGDAELVNGNLTDTEITVKWPSGGQYQFSCTMTTDAGKSATGYRNAYIFSDTYKPEDNFVVESLSGTDNGWSAEVTVLNPSDIAKYAGGREVVLFFERLVEGVPTKLSTEGSGKYQLLFRGWIDGGSIRKDPAGEWVRFSVLGPAKYMETQENFPVALNNIGTAIDWTEFPNLTSHGALFHLLKWHSTILDVTDLHIPDFSEVERLLGGFEFKQDSVANQAATLAEATLARFGSSRDGSLWFTIDPARTPYKITKNLVSPWLETVLTEDNVIGEIEAVENKIYKTSRVEASGVAFRVDHAEAIIASSPGEAPLYGGRGERLERLALKNAMDAGEIARQMLGYLNRDIEEVATSIPGTFGIDLYPIRTVKVTYPNSTFGLDQTECILAAIDVTFERNGSMVEELTLIPLVEPEFYATVIDSTVTNVSLSGGQLPNYMVAYPEVDIFEIDPERALASYVSMANRDELFFGLGAKTEAGEDKTFLYFCPEKGEATWYRRGALIPLADDSVEVLRPNYIGPLVRVRTKDGLLKDLVLSAVGDEDIAVTEIDSIETVSWDLDYEYVVGNYETEISMHGFTLYKPTSGGNEPYLLTLTIPEVGNPDQIKIIHKFFNPRNFYGNGDLHWTTTSTLPIHRSITQVEGGTLHTYTTFLTFVNQESGLWTIYEVGFIAEGNIDKPWPTDSDWVWYAANIGTLPVRQRDVEDEWGVFGVIGNWYWYKTLYIDAVITASGGKLSTESMEPGDSITVSFCCGTHFGLPWLSRPSKIGESSISGWANLANIEPISAFTRIFARLVTDDEGERVRIDYVSSPVSDPRPDFEIPSLSTELGLNDKDYIWSFTNVYEPNDRNLYVKYLALNRGSIENPMVINVSKYNNPDPWGPSYTTYVRALGVPGGAEPVKGKVRRIGAPWTRWLTKTRLWDSEE